jgi:hypothetical protein
MTIANANISFEVSVAINKLHSYLPSYNRFSVYTSAVKMPTIANEKNSFEVKFVQITLSYLLAYLNNNTTQALVGF